MGSQGYLQASSTHYSGSDAGSMYSGADGSGYESGSYNRSGASGQRRLAHAHGGAMDSSEHASDTSGHSTPYASGDFYSSGHTSSYDSGDEPSAESGDGIWDTNPSYGQKLSFLLTNGSDAERNAFCGDECVHDFISRLEDMSSKCPRSTLVKTMVAMHKRVCAKERQAADAGYCVSRYRALLSDIDAAHKMDMFSRVCPPTSRPSAWNYCSQACADHLKWRIATHGCCDYSWRDMELVGRTGSCGFDCIISACNLTEARLECGHGGGCGPSERSTGLPLSCHDWPHRPSNMTVDENALALLQKLFAKSQVLMNTASDSSAGSHSGGSGYAQSGADGSSGSWAGASGHHDDSGSYGDHFNSSTDGGSGSWGDVSGHHDDSGSHGDRDHYVSGADGSSGSWGDGTGDGSESSSGSGLFDGPSSGGDGSGDGSESSSGFGSFDGPSSGGDGSGDGSESSSGSGSFDGPRSAF